MIQTRNQYLQFMLVMLAAWGISWGARFVMEQAVLLYGSGKNYLFFSHGTVLMYLLCVFLVYRRWIAPLPVVGQLRNVGVPWEERRKNAAVCERRRGKPALDRQMDGAGRIAWKRKRKHRLIL